MCARMSGANKHHENDIHNSSRAAAMSAFSIETGLCDYVASGQCLLVNSVGVDHQAVQLLDNCFHSSSNFKHGGF